MPDAGGLQVGRGGRLGLIGVGEWSAPPPKKNGTANSNKRGLPAAYQISGKKEKKTHLKSRCVEGAVYWLSPAGWATRTAKTN
jgi:hypothetical protein